VCAETESEAILEDDYLVVLDTLSRPLAANGVPVARLAASARVWAALGVTWSAIACDPGRVEQTARVEKQHSTRVASCSSQLLRKDSSMVLFLSCTNKSRQ
jgi:hypothetical protein